MTTSKPQTITSVTARHRLSGELEYYRSRDVHATQYTVIGRCGAHLSALGWDAKDIIICSVTTESEDMITQSVRNRLIKPRA